MKKLGAIGLGVLAAAAAAAATASAQMRRPTGMMTPPEAFDRADLPGGKRIRVTYQNLTTGQVLSPAVFVSHSASAPPLFREGGQADFGLQRMAEEGNGGPLLAMAVEDKNNMFGVAAMGVTLPPGGKRTLELDVDAANPMISGYTMLVRTNDGFTGVSGVNALALERPVSMDLYAWDAGTERNTEQRAHMVAQMGSGRSPEGGRVARHRGLHGRADAPAEWRFDPSRPVARITFEPVR